MDMPAPVPLGALESLLARSKQVMEKSLSDKPIAQKGGDKGLTESFTSQGQSNDYDDYEEKDSYYGEYKTPERDVTKVIDYTEEQVMASNLPPAVKEAMLKNRIPRLSGPPSKVSPEAIAKMTGIQPKPQQIKQPLRENNNNNNGMITISTEQLQAMIKEGIDDFFKNDYEKRITEAAIKKTINVLIKEGKINVKK